MRAIPTKARNGTPVKRYRKMIPRRFVNGNLTFERPLQKDLFLFR